MSENIKNSMTNTMDTINVSMPKKSKHLTLENVEYIYENYTRYSVKEMAADLGISHYIISNCISKLRKNIGKNKMPLKKTLENPIMAFLKKKNI